MPHKQYATEAELCSAFIKHNTRNGEWIAYPETCGFDILMVRKSDGLQIGIEAKLRLNAEVILQAAEHTYHWHADKEGPDHRAILVPWEKQGGALHGLLSRLQLTGIYFGEEPNPYLQWDPSGPEFNIHQTPHLATDTKRWHDFSDDDWHDLCPAKRCNLPDYVPDTHAGTPSPIQLTNWKVRAIKIAVILEKVGFVTRSDFTYHQISMPRWTQSRWLVPGAVRGQWVACSRMPRFKEQHPRNFEEIAADYETWKQKEKQAA